MRLQAGVRANADAHRARIMRERERTLALFERARRAVATSVRQHNATIERCGKMLGALSHYGVLARGFALVRDLEGKPLRTAAAAAAAVRIDIEFADGHVRARPDGSSAAEAPATRPVPIPSRPRSRRGGGEGQGSLFGG